MLRGRGRNPRACWLLLGLELGNELVDCCERGECVEGERVRGSQVSVCEANQKDGKGREWFLPLHCSDMAS